MANEIAMFLVRAKKAVLSGQGGEAVSSEPNSQDLQYVEGGLKYTDARLGSSQFAGEEAMWIDGVPVWAMNYVGRVADGSFSADFLKEALLLVTEECPCRGPVEYENGDYTYKCSVKGDFGWFYGYEEIYYKDRLVYEYAFHGGEIE